MPTIHASAVLVGARAVLIRGPARAGKSRLVAGLLEAASCGLLAFARLVADDRVHVEAAHGRLLVRAPDALAGLIEVRGAGIRRVAHEAVAVVGLVVDLASAEGARLPEAGVRDTEITGVRLPRLAIAPEIDPLPPVLAVLRMPPADGPAASSEVGPDWQVNRARTS